MVSEKKSLELEQGKLQPEEKLPGGWNRWAVKHTAYGGCTTSTTGDLPGQLDKTI